MNEQVENNYCDQCGHELRSTRKRKATITDITIIIGLVLIGVVIGALVTPLTYHVPTEDDSHFYVTVDMVLAEVIPDNHRIEFFEKAGDLRIWTISPYLRTSYYMSYDDYTYVDPYNNKIEFHCYSFDCSMAFKMTKEYYLQVIMEGYPLYKLSFGSYEFTGDMSITLDVNPSIYPLYPLNATNR
ncbi:MAG: hypothetical protein ACFFD4_07835 [Candidatus Odinarchaeota archaeon]